MNTNDDTSKLDEQLASGPLKVNDRVDMISVNKDPFDDLLNNGNSQIDPVDWAVTRRYIAMYENLLESIIEQGNICVFSDPEQMNSFHLAMTRLRSRSGLNVESASLIKDDISPIEIFQNDDSLMYEWGAFYQNCTIDSEIKTEASPQDLSVFQSDDGEYVKTEEFLSRKHVALERINKIGFLRMDFEDGFELNLVYNRDNDDTECMHRSKNRDSKLKFFFYLLMRKKKVVITGEEKEIVRFLSKYIQRKCSVIKNDSTGFYILQFE